MSQFHCVFCVLDFHPRTKKTGQRVVRAGRKVRVLPSEFSEAWEQRAILELRRAWVTPHRPALRCPVNIEALFYRATNTTGDLHGYMQALADALEGAQVIANDRQITSWDGTRKLVDKLNPRTEVTIRWEAA